MTPQAFAADLATIPAMDDLTVRICSGGGDVWAAQAIGAMLENRLGTVTAQIEGICASAATIVASHCKVVKAAEDATYMIHPIKVNPNGFVDMEGLKQLMDALTVMRTNVLNQYAKKTGHTVEEVAAWMDATSWWTAAEAKENGFIDEITESNQTAKIENRNGALFVNSIAVPGTFDDAPEFVRNRAVVAPATTEGFVNNTDPAGKPDKNDGGNDMEFKNADELRNGCPDLVKEIVDEAHAEAQKQERDRLAAIDEIADTYTASKKWNENGGDFWGDVKAMCRMLSARGLPAKDLILGTDVADYILTDERTRQLLDKNSGIIVGEIRQQLTQYDGVVFMGTLNFGGFMLNVFSVDETYEDETGKSARYFPATAAMVTAPDCGHMMYGSITQMDYGKTDYTTYAAKRVAKLVVDQDKDTRKLRLGCRPLAAPKTYCPYIYAADVVG